MTRLTIAAALAVSVAGTSAAFALPPGFQSGGFKSGLQSGKFQINPGALKPGGVKLGQLPGGGVKIPAGKFPIGGPVKIPGYGKGYGKGFGYGGAVAAGLVGGMAIGALSAAAAPAYIEEDEGCYLVRKTMVDAYGGVVVRRVTVCE